MSGKLTPDERRQRYLSRHPDYAWMQEGSFRDADGKSVAAYDDVTLLEDIAIEGDENSPYRIPAGTIATVLFFQAEPGGLADLECCWPEGGFSFGFAPTQSLRLHMSGKDKGRMSSLAQ